jgi:hypothetical protein
MKKIVLSSLFFILIGIAGYAQSATPRADAREKTERARIRRGRKSGEVTNGEAAALNKQQRHIRRTERRAKADGEVTPDEKRKLERKQDRASRNIRRAKTNKVEKTPE